VWLPDGQARRLYRCPSAGCRGFFGGARRFSGGVPVGIYRSKLVISTVDKPLHFWYTVDATGKVGEYLKHVKQGGA